MRYILENIMNYTGYLLILVGIIHAFFMPAMRRHAKVMIFKLVKFIVEHGYLKYQKTSQMALVVALSSGRFRNRALNYFRISRVIRKNLRAILKNEVFTKDELRVCCSAS